MFSKILQEFQILENATPIEENESQIKSLQQSYFRISKKKVKQSPFKSLRFGDVERVFEDSLSGDEIVGLDADPVVGHLPESGN